MASPLFPIASVVELHGLVAATHLNGRRGVVCATGATSERLSILLQPVLGPRVPVSVIPEQVRVKPTNVKAVPDNDASIELRSMSSWELNSRINAVQSLMGTPGYDSEEHEALVKLQFKKMKKITKVRKLAFK
jgi:hypothetical protein